MTEQYGAPLTGAQMNLLRAAGLKGRGWQGNQNYLVEHHTFSDNADDYRLPADHAAYTLLAKGWLEKPNVRLWFGGDKAPDDWDKQFNGGEVLLRSGEMGHAITYNHWMHLSSHPQNDIIAYTRKADVVEAPPPARPDAVGRFLHRSGWEGNRDVELALQLFVEDCATIPKMTEAEIIASWQDSAGLLLHFANKLGLIKEPTREEQFWSTQPNGGAHVTDDVKAWVREALEFEQN